MLESASEWPLGLVCTLKQVAYAAVKGDVRPADKVAALDKMSNILGLYRDDRVDRDQRPVVTHFTVVLNRGHGGTAKRLSGLLTAAPHYPTVPLSVSWSSSNLPPRD